jgi:hypothetical protein
MATSRTRRRKPRRRKSEDEHFSGRVQSIIKEVVEEPEMVRAEVMSDHWGRHASKVNLDVYWFRATHLDGEVLSVDRAKRFLAEASKDGKVVREIERICGNLSSQYGWDSRQALRFLLTGKAPMLQPIEVEKLTWSNGKWGNFARVTLSFDLSVSARTMNRAILRLKRMAGQKDKRPIEEKAFRLADFVSETMFEPERLSRRAYMARWNADNSDKPEWQFDDVRHFVRACQDAKRSVLFMNNAPPELGPGEEYPGAF